MSLNITKLELYEGMFLAALLANPKRYKDIAGEIEAARLSQDQATDKNIDKAHKMATQLIYRQNNRTADISEDDAIDFKAEAVFIGDGNEQTVVVHQATDESLEDKNDWFDSGSGIPWDEQFAVHTGLDMRFVHCGFCVQSVVRHIIEPETANKLHKGEMTTVSLRDTRPGTYQALMSLYEDGNVSPSADHGTFSVRDPNICPNCNAVVGEVAICPVCEGVIDKDVVTSAFVSFAHVGIIPYVIITWYKFASQIEGYDGDGFENEESVRDTLREEGLSPMRDEYRLVSLEDFLQDLVRGEDMGIPFKDRAYGWVYIHEESAN